MNFDKKCGKKMSTKIPEGALPVNESMTEILLVILCTQTSIKAVSMNERNGENEPSLM